MDLGYSGTLNKLFHSYWGYCNDGITITECGSQLDSTIATLREVIPHAEDPGIVEH